MANSFPSTQVTGANAVAEFHHELDKVIDQTAATGFFTDNALGAKFVGAKTVSIPTLSMNGLGDYSRSDGFVGGDMTVTRHVYTLSMDRGRSFRIDRMDNDEAGVMNLIGETSTEFVRTRVVPEVDAYVLSKLAKLAETKSHTVTVGQSSTLAADCYKMFSEARNKVEEELGYNGDQLVAFVDSAFLAALESSSAFDRQIVVSDFVQGGISTKVKTVDGVILIPVKGDRMYDEFVFLNGLNAGGSDQTAGGFTPKLTTTGSGESAVTTKTHIGMLMCPRNLGGLVKKTEKLRVFTPEQNQAADGWKIDYRLYYDYFVKKSAENAVYAYTYSETVS